MDAAIAVTPLEDEKIKEVVLYYEPFVAYIPENHHSFHKKEIEVSDLNVNEILLLQDGHCFRDGILNLCKNLNQEEKILFKYKAAVLKR